MFKDEDQLYNKHMFDVFHQNFQEFVKNKGIYYDEINDQKFTFIRNLKHVWNSDSCWDKFDYDNTLLLECDDVKVYKNIENSLIIDQFKEEDI